ncbi:hypothetical protein RQP53_09515 [Paucibacter sp. APW11]|uniref:DUF4401 domain-containing protein n=1 Tax=Roseateles aquae TaxID=3077235 RepID=A0ABU3PBJ3_9BURK|nr:hypothetical protein [Paucibacter sp. APW11]MDT8999503.1 hypothetical protein [Paucibacter sp. APW11]
MLALKLFLVPSFLLLVSLAGARWGPTVAGWLAGLPVVAGPILFFLAIEHGADFASGAAAASLSAVFASVSFSLAYAHAAQRLAWPPSLLIALSAWGLAAGALWWLAPGTGLSLLLALLTLLGAPRLFPASPTAGAAHVVSAAELATRMLAGACLTLAVTAVAGRLGHGWSGLLSVFPVLGMVLAVFSQRSEGAGFVASLLCAMATGLYSFATFCLTLSLALPHAGIAAAFMLAACLSLTVQVISKRRLAAARMQPARP